MKTYWCYLLIAVLFSACSSEDIKSSELDLSKDENVLAELNKSNGNNFSKEDICIERPISFNDLILVGYFAHDRGCTGNIVFYKGKESTVSDIYQKLLLDHGWNQSSNREKLALNLVTEVLLKWVSPLFEEPNDFSQYSMHSFLPPNTRIETDEIIVSAWVLEPAGMLPESSYYLFTAAFNSKGKMVRSEMTDRFSINY